MNVIDYYKKYCHKIYYLSIFVIIIFNTVNTSGIVITGTVVDYNDKKSLTGAGIVLKCENDSICGGAISENSGLFSITSNITDLHNRSLILECKLPGFETELIQIDSTYTDKPIIIELHSKDQQLAEVVVKAYKQKLRIEPGKYIFNPKSIADIAADASIMLKYVPMLEVNEAQGTISLAGKPVKIQLNGRDCPISVTQLLTELSGMSPSQFKAIELIKNMGSSEFSTSKEATINIMFDFDVKGVFTNYRISSYLEDHAITPSGLASATIQHNNYSASISISGRRTQIYSKLSEQYLYSNDGEEVKVFSDKTGKGYFTSGTVYFDNAFYFRRNSFISFGANANISKGNINNDITTLTSSENDDPVTNYTLNKITNPVVAPPFGIYCAGRWLYDDNGSMIEAKASYFIDSSKELNTLNNFTAETNEIIESINQNTIKRFKGITAIFNGKQIFNNNYGTLNYGYNFFLANENTEVLKTIDNSNLAKLKRITHAVYASYLKGFGNLFSFRAGCRAEFYDTDINDLNESISYTSHDLQWIPNISLSFSFADGRHLFAIDAQKYLSLARIDMLNPHKIWISDNTYTCGNPYIKPIRDYSVKTEYTLFNDYTFELEFTKSLDNYHFSTIETNQPGIFATTGFNSGHSNALGLTFRYNKLLFDGIWNINLRTGISQSWYKYKENEQDYKLSQFSYGLFWNNTFLITKRHNIYADAFFGLTTTPKAPFKQFKGKTSRPMMDVSVTKKFGWGGKVSLGIYNICMKSVEWENIQPNYSYSQSDRAFPISINISFVYNLQLGKINRSPENYSDDSTQSSNALRTL